MKKGYLLFIMVLHAGFLSGQWNPDAGLVTSYTDQAKIMASGTNPGATTDNDPETKWESEAPLPSGYIRSEKQNILHNHHNFKTKTNPSGKTKATDGNTETASVIKNGQFTLRLSKSQNLELLSVKLSSKKDVAVRIISGGNQAVEYAISPDQAYELIQFRPKIKNAEVIEISSGSAIQLFEIAALSEAPYVEISFDLQRLRPVGWLETKQFAGEHVKNIKVYTAAENKQWNFLTNLNPEALNNITTRFQQQKIRFIRLRYQLDFTNYAKAYLWDIRAYNRHGPYGPMPAFSKPKSPLKRTLGINTFWGWGQNKHAGEIQNQKGPDQFKNFITQVRYYHNLDWDISKPGETPDYGNMPGSLNQQWLDWDQEYIPVWKKGFTLQTTLQIPPPFKPESWQDVTKQAAAYGSAFADYFGNTHHGLIEAVEIGNEPWKYGPNFYRRFFEGLAPAIKNNAPHINILPCALSANHQQLNLNNYVGEWLKESDKRYISGINTHLYSYAYDENGNRIAVHPEHPESEMRGILNILRFRNQNLPGKEVHVTEWGWDAPSRHTDCTHPECVSQQAQAAYAVRGMLFFYRLGVDKMHWFFFADEDKNSFQFTRSGLLTSPENGMEPKLAYFALQETIKKTGNLKLSKVEENKDVWIYWFSDQQGNLRHAVTWIPEAHDKTLQKEISIRLPASPNKAILPGKNRSVPINNQGGGLYTFKAGTYPLIISF
ncbi:MAG: hypothetical protein ACQESX_08510 [Bacteroidota bacterium]